MVLLVAISTGFFTGSPSASAQETPAITATATSAPHIWTITGSGFEPNIELRVMEVPCPLRPPSRCGGSGGTVGSFPTTSATGTFEVTLDFAGATPPEGADVFIVAAFPASRALEATDPTVEIPASAGEAPAATQSPTARPPATGTGAARDSGGIPTGAWVLLAAALTATAAGGIVVTRRAG